MSPQWVEYYFQTDANKHKLYKNNQSSIIHKLYKNNQSSIIFTPLVLSLSIMTRAGQLFRKYLINLFRHSKIFTEILVLLWVLEIEKQERH